MSKKLALLSISIAEQALLMISIVKYLALALLFQVHYILNLQSKKILSRLSTEPCLVYHNKTREEHLTSLSNRKIVQTFIKRSILFVSIISTKTDHFFTSEEICTNCVKSATAQNFYPRQMVSKHVIS